MNKSVSLKSKVDPCLAITFRCSHCDHTFQAAPERVIDAPDQTWHPYTYQSICNLCNSEVGQVAWERNLFKARLCSTGPKTAAGKAASAKNLAGHPTPEEAKRTRFNALKHGASAKTAVYFPARPGQYAQCEGCDVDHDFCASQIACVRRTELMMRYLSAVETGDLTSLNELNAINQANLAAVFQDMMLTIIKDGVSLRHNVFGFDKDGGFHTGDIEEVKAHPLLKPMLEFVSRNNLSMSDLNMTPKVQVDQGMEMGRLLDAEDDRDSANEMMQRNNDLLNGLAGMIERSRARIESDPVFIEYSSESEVEQVIEVQDGR